MLMSSEPTPDSMRATLQVLRPVRGLCSRDELHLRRLRHCLGMHLHLPGMISPLPGATRTVVSSITDEELLELLYEALADITGESEDDQHSITHARQVIATQLGKEPTILFIGGTFRIEPANGLPN